VEGENYNVEKKKLYVSQRSMKMGIFYLGSEDEYYKVKG